VLHDLSTKEILANTGQYLNYGIADDDVVLLDLMEVVYEVVHLLLAEFQTMRQFSVHDFAQPELALGTQIVVRDLVAVEVGLVQKRVLPILV